MIQRAAKDKDISGDEIITGEWQMSQRVDPVVQFPDVKLYLIIEGSILDRIKAAFQVLLFGKACITDGATLRQEW